ncbi:DUF1656 domain-containing protein [Burkholderia cenocepacia]|nr:DUF1656 domain-containing protein [Burkholderia cenocepacia]
MFSDLSVGDVFLPALLVLSFLALVLTGLSSRLLLKLDLYRLFAYRPFVDVSIFAIWLALLVRLGYFTGK